jgi:hypothetical protein
MLGHLVRMIRSSIDDRGHDGIRASNFSGLARLTKVGRVWTFSFVGKKRGRWRSPDDAALAVARHKTDGIEEKQP